MDLRFNGNVRESKKELTIVASIALVSFICRLWELTQSSFPNGVDGYYYAVQSRSILESGVPYYSDSPLALYLCAAFSWGFGSFLGPKIVVALAMAAFVFPFFKIARCMGFTKPQATAITFATAFSVQSFYIGSEFAKMGIGITLGLGTVTVLLPSASKRRLSIWVLLLILGTVTHPIASVIAIAGSLVPLWNLAEKRVLIVVMTLGLGWLILRTPWMEFSEYFSSSFSLADSEKGVFLGWETIASLVCGTYLIWMRSNFQWLLLAITCAFLACPFINLNPELLPFRLRILVWIPLYFALGRVLFSIPKQWVSYLLLFVFVVMQRPLSNHQNARVAVTPEMAAAVAQVKAVAPRNAVLITPSRQIMFMLTWYSRLPARMTPTESHARWVHVVPAKWINSEQRTKLSLASQRTPTSLFQMVTVNQKNALVVFDHNLLPK